MGIALIYIVPPVALLAAIYAVVIAYLNGDQLGNKEKTWTEALIKVSIPTLAVPFAGSFIFAIVVELLSAGGETGPDDIWRLMLLVGVPSVVLVLPAAISLSIGFMFGRLSFNRAVRKSMP